MRRTRLARTLPLLALVVGSLVWPGARAEAQVDVAMTSDGTAEGGVTVSSLLNGIKTRRGTTGSDGETSVPAGTFREGDRVTVWVRRCEDGEVEVVLAGPGEGDPCAGDDAAEGEACECERIGAFIWRDGTRVAIDTARGTVSTSEPATHGWSVGFGVDYFHFDNWEEVACAGAPFCEADDHGVGPVGFVEYLFGPWKIGGEVGYAKAPDVMRVDAGRTAEIETDFWNFGFYGGFSPLDWLQFDLGVSWLYNMADFSVLDDLTGPFDFEREEDNVNGFGRILFHIPLAPGWELVPGVGFSTNFEDDDAESDLVVPTFRTRFTF